MNILVAGGAGYIGSHTIVELLNEGHNIIVVDNLLNSSTEALNRVEALTGKKIKFYEEDICSLEALEKIFDENEIDAVIDFAGLKAAGESLEIPLEYYLNNINGTVNLLTCMKKRGIKRFMFSSSAIVYGNENEVPLVEEADTTKILNPYGKSKRIDEEILTDLFKADPEWNIVILRYFNPIGAHESGMIGENPLGRPTNLIPIVAEVASGQREKLQVFGDDYPTKDGTGIRDFIHVVDLAKGHVKALEKLKDGSGLNIYNLGTGNGSSVLDIIKTFEKVSGQDIKYEIVDRRDGDIAVSFCDCSKAKNELGWTAQKNLEDMCKDTWNWKVQNPKGYSE